MNIKWLIKNYYSITKVYVFHLSKQTRYFWHIDQPFVIELSVPPLPPPSLSLCIYIYIYIEQM